MPHESHNQAMIQHDDQQHQFPGEPDPGQRMRNAGYDWSRWGENIYAYPRSNLEAHGGFLIEWGPGPYGMRDPPDHRIRLMDASLQHIGVAIRNVGVNPATRVGPLVVTQDLAKPRVAQDPYVVGAVFNQVNGSPWYQDGSGLGNVSVVFEGPGGTFEATTMSAGGYQVQLPPGTYRGVASGGGLTGLLVSREFVIGNENVAVDFRFPTDQAALPVAHDDIIATHLGTGTVMNVTANDVATSATINAGSLSILAGPEHGSLSVAADGSGVLSYLPHGELQGIDEVIYRVMDSNGLWSNRARARIVVLDFFDHPWHNPWNPSDTSVDDVVSAFDALLIVNELNGKGVRRLPVPPEGDVLPPPLLDVSRDNLLSPRDALLVINQFNGPGNDEGEGEGQSEGNTENLIQSDEWRWDLNKPAAPTRQVYSHGYLGTSPSLTNAYPASAGEGSTAGHETPISHARSTHAHHVFWVAADRAPWLGRSHEEESWRADPLLPAAGPTNVHNADVSRAATLVAQSTAESRRLGPRLTWLELRPNAGDELFADWPWPLEDWRQ